MTTLLWLSLAHAGDNPYAWTAPSARVQVLSDNTAVPANMGAVFIPKLTNADEPDVLVVDGDSVRAIPVGQRVALDPGKYVVLVGSADPRLAQGIEVTVTAGSTAVVPARWGALRVEIVDRKLQRLDAPYELVHVESGRVVLIDPAQDEGLDTWLLAAGLYEVREPGARGAMRPDYVSVHVPSGGVVHLRVFMDRTGEIRGGGVIHADQALEIEEPTDSPVSGGLVAGVDFSGAQTHQVPGVPDSLYAVGGVFVDGNVRVASDHHSLTLNGNLNQRQAWFGNGNTQLPVFKVEDSLSGEAQYNFWFNDGTGIYGRGEATTQLLDTNAIALEETEVARRAEDGTVTYETVAANGTYKLADAFSPMLLEGGAGFQVRPAAWRAFELSFQGGAAWRRYAYNGAWISEDNPNTPAFELTQLGSFDQVGLEGAVVLDARLTGWATLHGELEAFSPVGEWTNPALSLETGLSMRMTDILSLNYAFTVNHIPALGPDLQVRQGLYLRGQWSVL